MIDVKELLEDFLTLGCDNQQALRLAKEECAKRKKIYIKSRKKSREFAVFLTAE